MTEHPFDFQADTFAYPNELVWEYFFDAATGKSSASKRQPPPSYAHHCFVVARTARQFWLHAEFDPGASGVTDAEYLALVKSVARSDPQQTGAGKIRIPGFANLRRFSEARPALLKAGCGGAWQSYFQRGNWRMVFPFSRRGQESAAESLARGISRRPIIHVATFPSLTINHALLLFGRQSGESGIEFRAYDPNNSERPLALVFDRASRSFQYPQTNYFPGGLVNAYEIYCGRCF